MLTSTYDPFGVLLKQFRKRQHITQNKLAEAMGVHRNTVGRWEEGSFLPASKAVLVDLARYLHLDESEARQFLDASLLTPVPLWSVPYPRNPFFTGREDQLETLQALLAPGQPVTSTQSYALHGLGGIGKTQLALEYAYRCALAYRAVFWIGAETAEQIHASLLRIAERLELPEHSEADQQRLMMAVQHWLETNREWLLIWDNLEDLDLLRRYLPSIQTGAVLITTRSQTLGTLAQGINLAPMEKEEGALFLLRRAKIFASDARCEQLRHLAGSTPAEHAAALDLVTALGGLPLALDQAGAYIEETKCGFTEFLALFQRYPLQLLQERGTHAEHPTSVVKTFVLSFEKLQQTHKASAELLIACCFLAPEEIPEALFTDHAIWFPPGLQQMITEPLTFHRMLKNLLAYALVHRNPTNRTLSVHRLVQAVLKAQLSDEQQQEWLARLVNLLVQAFPQDVNAVETWQWCEQVLPHALHCLEQVNTEHPELGYTLLGLGDLYVDSGKYQEAEALYQRVADIWNQTNAENPDMMAYLLYSQAHLLFHRGRYTEAEKVCQRTVAVWRQHLGPDHANVARALQLLGRIWQAQNRCEQAEQAIREALAIRLALLEVTHPDVADIYHTLSELFTAQGKDEQAESMYQQTLHTCEQTAASFT